MYVWCLVVIALGGEAGDSKNHKLEQLLLSQYLVTKLLPSTMLWSRSNQLALHSRPSED